MEFFEVLKTRRRLITDTKRLYHKRHIILPHQALRLTMGDTFYLEARTDKGTLMKCRTERRANEQRSKPRGPRSANPAANGIDLMLNL